MISETPLIGQISEHGPQHPSLDNGSDEEQGRETEGRKPKTLQTQGGCHEKVERCESNKLRGCTRAALTSNSLLSTCLNSTLHTLQLWPFCCKSMSSGIGKNTFGCRWRHNWDPGTLFGAVWPMNERLWVRGERGGEECSMKASPKTNLWATWSMG